MSIAKKDGDTVNNVADNPSNMANKTDDTTSGLALVPLVGDQMVQESDNAKNSFTTTHSNINQETESPVDQTADNETMRTYLKRRY